MTLPTLEDVAAAREALAGVAIRTPLIRLNGAPDGGPQIWLKLENLQPTGSFKLRGAAAVLARATADQLAAGIVTASAGNMGLGAAWFARRLGVRCTVLVPPTAPASKIEAMEAQGATVIRVTHDVWWTAFVNRRAEGIEGVFIHAFDDPRVMAGNGTIAMEILEDLPATTAILVPWGGGGLTCGIAAVARELAPSVRVYAAEVDTAAPWSAALAAGAPVTVEMAESFVDGIGSRTVLDSMFPRATELGVGSLVAGVDDVAAALVALLERNHVLAEGAGATPVACALQPGAFTAADTVVCVVSGGMIDRSTILDLLSAAG
ncbi:MAG TPA: pyridoxal-phosphate dependent enzyme [Micromonosporaceae bacterium]